MGSTWDKRPDQKVIVLSNFAADVLHILLGGTAPEIILSKHVEAEKLKESILELTSN